MATDPGAPADTTMMRVVHQALRRDLARARKVLAAGPVPTPDRQRAIGSHLTWMMGFLRAHHDSEDRGLYAVVRQRAATRADAVEVVEVLDRMDAQHHAIAPAVTEVEAAAARLDADASDAAVAGVVVALDALTAVLLSHLEQEETEAMPLVSELVTHAEWLDVERRYNLEPKSFVELGREGHWLIDDASDADRATVLGLVPAMPRFLLHGFARGYRRRKEACWGAPTAHKRRRVQKHGRVEASVAADIDAVWDVVRDVTRVGEWSHECVGAEWVGDSTAALPGARFRGRNRAGVFRWGRVCEIVAADPYELVWRTVPTRMFPDSSEWRIALEATEDGGTRIEQRFRVLHAPKMLDPIFARLVPNHRDRDAALTDDLRRLGDVASRRAALRA